MPKLLELRNEIEKNKKEKQYNQAIKLYETLWSEYKNEIKNWDYWGYAFCLNQTRQYEKSLKLCIELINKDKSFTFILGQYAWAFYFLYIKNYDPKNESLSEFLNKAKEAIDITEPASDELFRFEIILKVMEVLCENNMWDQVIKWSEKLILNKLSEKSVEIKIQAGKKIRYPSQKEKYYSLVTKAYEKSGNFASALSLVNEGLKFYPDDIWLLRRKAIALMNLKCYEDSLKILEGILIKKPEWFIYRDIAKIYLIKDDIHKALKYAVEGCLKSFNNPNKENLWELYYISALIYEKMNNKELTKKHLKLVYTLRKEKNWQITDELSTLITKYEIDKEESQNSNDLLKELYKNWEKVREADVKYYYGVISKILTNGFSGFIKSEDGDNVFFRVKAFIGNKKDCIPGKRVKYSLEKSFDNVKNKESYQAVNIKLID